MADIHVRCPFVHPDWLTASVDGLVDRLRVDLVCSLQCRQCLASGPGRNTAFNVPIHITWEQADLQRANSPWQLPTWALFASICLCQRRKLLLATLSPIDLFTHASCIPD
ncbi:hypothetical protein V2G26_020843 [Clonostachys chloroleuca]